MWIRTIDPEVPDYSQREERYARHLRAVKRAVSGRAFDWLLDDKLHDAKLIAFACDVARQEACFTFDCVGAWPRRDGKWVRPQTQRLTFTFNEVSGFVVAMPSVGQMTLAGAEYIIGELNTSPKRRGRRGLLSIDMVLSNEVVVELSFLFRKVRLTRRLMPPK